MTTKTIFVGKCENEGCQKRRHVAIIDVDQKNPPTDGVCECPKCGKMSFFGELEKMLRRHNLPIAHKKLTTPHQTVMGIFCLKKS
ncbi:hypothetical protein ACFL16_01585 [Patescibacteria group bacterium]